MAPEVLFTPAAMQRAWRAIRAAGGGPGVDGQTLQGFERHLEAELERLRGELVAGSYRPQVVRQVLVPKRKEGLRPLAMWCLRDRVAQRAVYDIVAPSFESVFLPVSFGFRPGLGTQDAAAQVAAHRDQGLQWVVDADIDSCFDSIRRGRLLRLTARRVQNRHVLGLIEAWLEARILNTASGRPAAAAVAQGARFVPRQGGSGTRLLLDHLGAVEGVDVARLVGAVHAEDSHLAVAAAVASGQAEIGLGIEAAAREFGLDFVPLAQEQYFLCCLRDALDAPPVQALRAVLASAAWRAVLAELPGYVADGSGDVLALTKALPWWRFRRAKNHTRAPAQT